MSMWQGGTIGFSFFKGLCLIAKSVGTDSPFWVLAENYLFLYNALSNPFLAILALSFLKKNAFIFKYCGI